MPGLPSIDGGKAVSASGGNAAVEKLQPTSLHCPFFLSMLTGRSFQVSADKRALWWEVPSVGEDGKTVYTAKEWTWSEYYRETMQAAHAFIHLGVEEFGAVRPAFCAYKNMSMLAD